MTNRVLFVCLGNICRSPLAEGLLRHHATQNGLDVEVDSAAVAGWHEGKPADPRAIVAAREAGFNIDQIVSRQLQSSDFSDDTLVLVMDQECLDKVNNKRPSDSTAEISLMMRFASDPRDADVPDPYFTGQFDPVIAMLDDCMPQLLHYLRDRQ